ncbi:hypothetical protein LSTR_LSTR006500 [Laodelphax striatellus]|uniref:Uncharacterized protein n=1 Tax=Laodelphax striatellus TaxID=195883 RepID=A0A482WY49_LAOST|nr:hypothetical protein LSTR_LSTR006500 [Laodelphax striatellus]
MDSESELECSPSSPVADTTTLQMDCNFTSGEDYTTIARTLAYDPIRLSGPSVEADSGLLLKSTFFNCLVISDEPRSFIEKSQIADSLRKTYYLKNSGATSASD